MIQPLMSFLEDEFGISRRAATLALGAVAFVACQPAIFFLKNGFVDEMDFWGVTMFLVIFATIEIILFGWVFGMKRGWVEMHLGARFKIPGFYKYVIKYVTPAYLLVLLGFWIDQQGMNVVKMTHVPPENRPYVWGARAMILALWGVVIALVWWIWKRRGPQAAVAMDQEGPQ